MYLRRIDLSGIRGFDEASFDLTASDGSSRGWTLLVGSNGTGKTTILRAVAIGIADITDANAMLATPVARMLGEGRARATIRIAASSRPEGGGEVEAETVIVDVNGAELIETSGPRMRELLKTSGFPAIAGYGVARHRTGRDLQRGGRLFDTTASLFSYDAQLTPLELTLRRMRDFLGEDGYARALGGIKRTLKLPEDCTIELPPNGGVTVATGAAAAPIPIEAWADGYRLNLAWIVDFFGIAMSSAALREDGAIEGLLLIDEIEQHAHPSIQRTIVAELKALWPRLQVIATTYSPLTVLGADASEIVVLKRRADGRVAQVAGPVSFRGYSAEDILNDERIFDTEAVSAEEAGLLEDYKAVASIEPDRRTDEQERRLSTLARQIGPSRATRTSATRTRGGADALPDEDALVEELARIREKYRL